MRRFFGFLMTLMLVILMTACGGGGGPVVPVDDLVQEGQTALLSGDGSAAEASFSEALAASPNHPGANFGMAFVELMALANDLVEFLSTQNDPLFRNLSWYFAAPVLNYPVAQDSFVDLNRVISSLDDDIDDVEIDDNTFEAIRLEVLSLLDSLETIRSYMRKTIDGTNGNDAWTFTVLEDWNDPSAGYVNIWRGDVIALSAALNAVTAGLHLGVAYSPGPLAFEMDEWGGLVITGIDGGDGNPPDTNGDNYIDLYEIADHEGAPGAFGVLAEGGRSHLDNVVVCMRRSVTEVRDAVDSYIAIDAPQSHWAFEDINAEDFADFKADWLAYGRAYANDLIAAFTNGTTLTIRPQLLEDYPELADDPGLDFTLRVNLAAFFSNMPDDLRDFPIRFEYDEWDCLVLPELATDAFTDNTLLGLFPDGVPQKYYEDI